jgi:uncharacterized protein YbjT (DUF2867 family)
MFIVTGATGNTGGATADWLLKAGKDVTVVVRSKEKGAPWAQKGAKVAVAELEDQNAMAALLADAQGAYLLVPPNYAGGADYASDRKRVSDALAAAVKSSRVPHVVLLSSVGAEHASGTGPIITNHNAEEAMMPAANNLTVLRASYFLENWQPVVPKVRNESVLPTFLIPDRKIPMVATDDIGRVAAESLISPAQGRRVIQLSGPEDYSPMDIAGVFAGLLKRDITVQPVPAGSVVPVLTSMGVPEPVAKVLAEMYRGINSGLVDFEKSGERVRGRLVAAEVFRPFLR